MSRIKTFVFGRGSYWAYIIITVLFMITPEEYFIKSSFNKNWSDAFNVLFNRILIGFIVLIIVNVLYWVCCRVRKNVILSGDNFEIQVSYGDLLDIPSGKIVINFDECYTTSIGDATADIKADTVCGQYILKHPEMNIQEIIKYSGVMPEKGKSKYNHKYKYKPGTIVPNGRYLLMAFAKLDDNGRGCLTYKEYTECLNYLWEQIDRYHGTDDVYIPIFGSNITRFDRDLSQQELLDIIITSYWLSPWRMKKPRKLHIICKKQEGFSLGDVSSIIHH